MLVFCHLWVGAVLGVLLSRHLKNDIVLPVCLVCSILPDLIDKPIGHILLSNLQDGRIYAHTILFLFAWAVVISLLCRRSRYYSALLYGGTGGIAAHQLLDQMWEIPQNWFYPFLGPFPPMQFENYFAWGLMKELTTISEWFFAIALVIPLYLMNESRSFSGYSRGVPALSCGIVGVFALMVGH